MIQIAFAALCEELVNFNFTIIFLQLFMKTTAVAIKPCCSLKCDKTNDGQLFDYIGRINVS